MTIPISPAPVSRGAGLISGHRGASATAPEDTMAAFRQAYDVHADMISIDVHRSKDGRLMVIHDATVDRTTDGHGYVKDLTFQQLRALDAGAKKDPKFGGERIPTLDEVLDWADGKIRVDIEIKDPQLYPGIEQQLADVIHQRGIAGSTMVDSFDFPSIRAFKALAPDVQCGYLVAPEKFLGAVKAGVAGGLAVGLAASVAAGISPLLGASLTLGAGVVGLLAGAEVGRQRTLAPALEQPLDVVMPYWLQLSPRWTEKIHRQGQAVVPYTENAPRLVHRLLHMGADGIITDTPERFEKKP